MMFSAMLMLRRPRSASIGAAFFSLRGYGRRAALIAVAALFAGPLAVHSRGQSAPAEASAATTLPVDSAGADVASQPSASEPAPATQPAATTQPAGTSQPTTQPTTDTSGEPKKIPLSFNNAPMPEIAKFLNKRFGKPVIIDKDVQNMQVTLVNPDPLGDDEAMYILTTALHTYGVAIEERERTVHLIPIKEIVKAQIPTIGPDERLDTYKPANTFVRKVFQLRQFDVNRMIEALRPLMPDYGQITADPTAGKLFVVATVERLMLMERMIQELDQPDVTGGELRVFTIQNVDVYEIIPMLEKLIAGYLGVEVKSVSGGTSGGIPGGMPGRPGGGGGGEPAGGAIVIKADKTPVLLIPEPRRSALVVAAPGNVLKQIEGWLMVLDQPKPASTQTELVEVRFTDAEELARQLRDLLNNMLDESLRSALRIIPFPSSRRLMIVGSEENRKIVMQWMQEIDVPDTGIRETRTFTLKYADAEQVAENIKELFGEESSQRRYFYYSYDRGGGGGEDRSKVTVTANPRSNSITVVASPEKMTRIAEQIAEWDAPLTGEEAAPRIYTLKYADPEKTRALLESLFTRKESGMSMPYWWYDDMPEEKASPVGRLFGQFSFEAYADTGKLIVVSKNEENYRVIDQMIAEIDRPQELGLPRIIELKFADAETLAEQLNALLNAPGTPTSILRRGEQGMFEQFADEASPYARTQDSGNQQQQRPTTPEGDNSQIRFWWQQTPPEIKVRQPSTLVGKIRIVPNVEQNLLLVAAPEEYAQAVADFIQDMDRPGNQVLIKAVIAEIIHDDETSLGYRFSTDPTVFTTGDNPLITENALRGLLNYSFEDMFGSQNTLTLDVDVNNLISMLRRVTALKIRSEPKILTADNVEAEFFDGQDIPFISRSQVTEAGNSFQDFDYFPVGITLRVRPHITKEENPHIDLTVKVRISSVIPGRTLFGAAVVDRRETTTRIVLENEQTFMISGILRSEQREITRRIPGLGDIPLVGELFKHRELGDANTELLIFLTPYVIGPRHSRDVIQDEPLRRMEELMNPQEAFGPAAAAPILEAQPPQAVVPGTEWAPSPQVVAK